MCSYSNYTVDIHVGFVCVCVCVCFRQTIIEGETSLFLNCFIFKSSRNALTDYRKSVVHVCVCVCVCVHVMEIHRTNGKTIPQLFVVFTSDETLPLLNREKCIYV